jgi:hypothetical protein
LKIPFQKRNTIAAIEAEMATLSKRRAEVASRISDIHAELEAARFERRETLSADGDLGTLTGKIRELTVELADLETLVVDINSQGKDAAGRLIKARDEAERATFAASLEKIALNAESRIPELEKTAAAFAKAVAGLRADLGDAGLWPTHGANRPAGSADAGHAFASSREIAAAVAAEALAKKLPWLFDYSMTTMGYQSGLFRLLNTDSARFDWISNHPYADPLSVDEMVHATLCNPLRGQASSIRAGAVDIEKPARPTVVDDYVRPEAPPNVAVFVTAPFSFLPSEFGVLEIVPSGWVRMVPEPVAAIAEERDLCVRASSIEGQALLARARERKGSSDAPVRPEDCTALGDVLNLRAPSNQVIRQATAS